MVPFMTTDQESMLELLNQFGALREDQTEKMLKHKYPSLEIERTIFPLITSRKIKRSDGYLFSKSGKLDEKIIDAIDIMLMLGADFNEPYLKGKDPFVLTFFKQREDKLWRYDICPVAYGTEAVISAQLEHEGTKYRMFVFMPEKAEQMQGIKVDCEHCYVLKNESTFNFYLFSKKETNT